MLLMEGGKWETRWEGREGNRVEIGRDGKGGGDSQGRIESGEEI